MNWLYIVIPLVIVVAAFLVFKKKNVSPPVIIENKKPAHQEVSKTEATVITPAPITISAPTIAPKVYNGTTAAGVITLGTVSGTLVGEALTITPSATAYSSANVGAAYTSTVSYVVTDGVGGLAANYSTLASNNLTGLSSIQY